MITLRQRWKAFYSLYRLAKKNRWTNQIESSLRILFAGSTCETWLDVLIAAGDTLASRRTLPKEVRRIFVDVARRQRLYGTLVERAQWHDCDQRVARQLQDKGIEMTPLQVTEARRAAFKRLRQRSAELGFTLPKNDFAMLALLQTALKHD